MSGSKEGAGLAAAAAGPMLWGTTYVVFTAMLPVDHPVLIAAYRALFAGMLLFLFVRRLPPLPILAQVTLLSLSNIGVFFALLMISASRLPGGITATLAACQPLLVAFLAWPMLGRRPRAVECVMAVVGMAGVGLMVMPRSLVLDLPGVLSGAGAALSMAFGIVLSERWRGLAPPLPMVTWQLVIAGLLLLPLALAIEGMPDGWSAHNTLGLGYLVVIVTALGYWLWIAGLQRIGTRAGVFAFLSPLVALFLGAVSMRETLDARQIVGVCTVILSMVTIVATSRRPAAVPSSGAAVSTYDT